MIRVSRQRQRGVIVLGAPGAVGNPKRWPAWEADIAGAILAARMPRSQRCSGVGGCCGQAGNAQLAAEGGSEVTGWMILRDIEYGQQID